MPCACWKPPPIIFSAAFRDTPRKRAGAQSGSSASVSAPNVEPQPEEAVDENFPVSTSVRSVFTHTMTLVHLVQKIGVKLPADCFLEHLK